MSLRTLAGHAADRISLPDVILRTGISAMVGRTARLLAAAPAEAEARFIAEMAGRPVAESPEAANAQHYELPPEFFALVLGPHRKYSCCLYEPGDTLAQAEARALAETCAHAGLADGQTILELGCGWGSLSLWMAERYPASRITAVSNSRPQREFIEGQARARGLGNLEVVTADMNGFAPAGRFDRVVSVEMFEHMANWPALLGRVRGWVAPEGRLFLHVFSHRSTPYRFETEDKADWIAQHFFTGGIMPSHALPGRFPELFAVEAAWRWSGNHYAQTARDWLAHFDARADEIAPILRRVYGEHAAIWTRRWRLFFLATEGLFGYAGGAEWGVSHYRLAPT
jgi:cyclopropane-fatty-acyl-phospholipid synthase